METNILNTRIVLRHDTTANWTTNTDQVLLKGEIGIEFLEDESVRVKIGDGVKPWSQLSYFGGEGGQGVIMIGDGKTIQVNGDTISLYGADGATAGMSPRLAADGTLEWYTPVGVEEITPVIEETLADILETSETAKASIEATVINSKSVEDKIVGIVDEKVSTVYTYKGSVANYAELPTEGNKVGDTYNVVAADPAHGITAGDNVTWDGEKWDNIGGYVDLSGYAEKAEVEPVIKKVSSMPAEILSEIISVDRTENTNTADVRISVLQEDGTYTTEDQKGVLTLIGAGEGPDGKSGAGLMTLADKLKLDAIPKVVSSEDDNKVKVNEDGTLEVNSLTIDKLKSNDDVVLVLNGGTSSLV